MEVGSSNLPNPTKHCSRCDENKPLSDYSPNARRPDGVSTYCKPCKRSYDREYWARTQKTRNLRKQTTSLVRRRRNRQFVLDYLRVHPCVDCGETDPVVLEPDHQGNKRANVSVLVSSNSLAVIETELQKCDIRCANCHRRRTSVQQGWYRDLDC